ncbi:VOC family protein [Paeniglutamicibacter psychrophenolicus]|uniref:VOC family protein n=1 Tax=Paeniglutamicibacter psychrophenolicus TaxID=257454 RepID=UPI00278451A4|nr:hypothetical protein [Paeniglutamicibacter psychrophenolicus]MDQ0094511.1 catechol-2,3-dioxygenase [Paeniglutamicibacter psychrophenolicus]
MKIPSVSLTVRNVPQAVEFYRDILLLPVETTPAGAEVAIGSSRLMLSAGDAFDGVHHLAFGILPSEFDVAHASLARRVPLLPAGGSEVILGSDEWKSRSRYCLGPEGIILEFIARDADASTTTGKGEMPQLLSISEVGIGVEDVPATVATLSEKLAIPQYFDCSSTFASMGSHDGLLIVVQRDRLWFPNKLSRPARGPLTIQIESPAGNARVDFGPNISIVSR